MLKKLYTELVLIRKELQAIRSSMEPCSKDTIDYKRVAEIISRIQYDKIHDCVVSDLSCRTH